jgi:hypothetical protein
MRLVHVNNSGELSLVGPFHGDVPPYAILSHRWRDGEVTFHDFTSNISMDKAGYGKLLFCAGQARRLGLNHFWIDTCCINRESTAELSEAIISMFRWYKKAVICYAYLDDVSAPGNADAMEAALATSEWFERGWTLQELLAPTSIQFFSKEHELLGDRDSLLIPIHSITGIALPALRGRALASFTIDERMRWVAARKTTREEDQAYALLGIFDISMSALYGEGKERAMARLKDKLARVPTNAVAAPPPTLPTSQPTRPIPRSTVPFRRDRDFVDVGILDNLEERCSEPAARTVLVGLGGVGYAKCHCCSYVEPRLPQP